MSIGECKKDEKGQVFDIICIVNSLWLWIAGWCLFKRYLESDPPSNLNIGGRQRNEECKNQLLLNRIRCCIAQNVGPGDEKERCI